MEIKSNKNNETISRRKENKTKQNKMKFNNQFLINNH